MSSNKERRRWEQFYGHLYLRPIGVDFSRCVYCGWPKEDIDHCPPLKWVYALGSDYFKRKSIPFVLLPACRECNSLLLDRRLFTLVDRATHLHSRIGRRYKRFRESVLWEQEDIEELTGRMRKIVENFSAMQIATDRRMENLLALRVSEEEAQQQ